MTRRTLPRIAPLLLLVAALLAPLSAPRAELHITINQANIQPIPIAITDFHSTVPSQAEIGHQIAGVVTANLENSGLFRPVSPAAFLQTPEQLQATPRFQDWKVIGADALVSGRVVTNSDGRLRVEFRLWDVQAGRQLEGLAYLTTPQNWRRIAHIISDAIYKRITGEDGYFDSRVVYIAESGSPSQRVKRLAIMDQDGANQRTLTDGRVLVLTPRFSPTAQEITYLAYVNNKPRVYLYNIDTGRQEVLGDFPGMSFAPRFSPDGNQVVMSRAQNGNTDIYVMNLRNRQIRRLTDNLSIETAPSFSPDGRQITFESDRSGSQQIYVMEGDGGNPRRISFGEGRYASPVWSPRGDLIAFIKLLQGQFYLGVMRPDGSGERLLTQAFHVEGPTWSPNGRVLMFFKELPSGQAEKGRTARLYSIDLTGRNERVVPTQGDASDPAWSGQLP